MKFKQGLKGAMLTRSTLTLHWRGDVGIKVGVPFWILIRVSFNTIIKYFRVEVMMKWLLLTIFRDRKNTCWKKCLSEHHHATWRNQQLSKPGLSLWISTLINLPFCFLDYSFNIQDVLNLLEHEDGKLFPWFLPSMLYTMCYWLSVTFCSWFYSEIRRYSFHLWS